MKNKVMKIAVGAIVVIGLLFGGTAIGDADNVLR